LASQFLDNKRKRAAIRKTSLQNADNNPTIMKNNEAALEKSSTRIHSSEVLINSSQQPVA